MNKIQSSILIFLSILSFNCNNNSELKASIIKSEQIIEAINKGKFIEIKDATIKGVLDFTSVKNQIEEIPGIQRAYIDVPLSFINCIFEEKVIAFSKSENTSTLSFFSKGVSFINCKFNDEVNFDQAVINGIINTNQSSFAKECFFQGASFRSANNYFMEVTFQSKAMFSQLHVLGNINFMRSEFYKEFSLKNSFVQGKTLIGAAKFKAYADFSSSRYIDFIDFKYSKFEQKTDFSFSVFHDHLKLDDAEFLGELSIEKASFYEELQFLNTRFSEKTMIKHCYFHQQSITDLQSIQNYLSENFYFIN
jgi:copper chaperone CopZ